MALIDRFERPRVTPGHQGPEILIGERAYVQIRCNGEVVAHGLIGPDWTTLSFLTDGSIGEQRITVEAWARPYRGGPPAGAGDVGVAVAAFRVALPPRGTVSP